MWSPGLTTRSCWGLGTRLRDPGAGWCPAGVWVLREPGGSFVWGGCWGSPVRVGHWLPGYSQLHRAQGSRVNICPSPHFVNSSPLPCGPWVPQPNLPLRRHRQPGDRAPCLPISCLALCGPPHNAARAWRAGRWRPKGQPSRTPGARLTWGGGLNSADHSPGEPARGLRGGLGTLRTLLYTHEAGAE